MTSRINRLWTISLALGLAIIAARVSMRSSQGEDLQSFYKDATVNMVIGSSPGGGYDLYGRLVARFIGDHIPGKPRVVTQNMPGASGVGALRHVYSVAPKDGLTIGTTLRDTFFDPLLYPDRKVDFDARKFVWLGSVNSETTLCVAWYTSKIKNFDDLKRNGMTVGGNGPTSTDVLFARLLNTIAGTKIRALIGYPGAAEVTLAMQRGELDGRCGLGWDDLASLHPDWLRDKKVRILVQFGLRKNPHIPNVPWIMDMAKTRLDRTLLLLFLGPNLMGRPFFGTPGMPADRAAALQKAFADMMDDPAFLNEAKKEKIAIDPMNASDVATLVNQIFASPEDALKEARTILNGG